MSRNIKKSIYNYFTKYDEENYIIYNTYSSQIALIENDVFERYKTGKLSYDEEDSLFKRGFFIDENVDEKAVIDEERVLGMHNTKYKMLRIWTTSACNANCFYCFEKGIEVQTMNKTVADKLISVMEKMLEEEDILRIEWFGGEPLLNADIITYISDSLIKICDKKKCKYSAYMITNGSMINEQVVQQMLETWKVTSVQITLDGYGQCYDSIKQYDDAKINFFDIVNTIEYVSKKNIYVAVRMNYTTDNAHDLKLLLDYLYKRFKDNRMVGYYLYPIWSSLNKCDTCRFISETKADSGYLELIKYMIKLGISEPRILTKLRYKEHQCNGCLPNSYAIFPNGDIGKCSECYSIPIGNVWEGVTNKLLCSNWLDTDLDKKCDVCIFLPMCQGGCRAGRVTDIPQCFAHKDIMPDLLRLYIDYLKEKQKKKDAK